jgi:ADP-ribose pyrophosphatase YjhB (NUDIX family)
MVTKSPGGYTLSTRGLQYADKHSSSLKSVREQAKIITIVVLTNDAGHVLLVQKEKQPFIGSYHLPAGKIHSGELVHEAAKRELEEKTGIKGVELTEKATVHVQIIKDDIAISEYFGFIVVGAYEKQCDGGIWYDPNASSDVNLAPSVSEVIEVATALSNKQLHEITIELV